jgi:hypothetical protein
MIPVVRKLRALSRAEWADLALGAPRLVVVWALLPVTGIRRLRRWTGRGPDRSGAVDFERWRRRAVALRRIGARLPGCRCLARSMALSWWMGSAGVGHRLRIGVAGTAATLRSHSWIEVAGVVVDDEAENVRGFREIVEI